jgi:polycomb protein EED
MLNGDPGVAFTGSIPKVRIYNVVTNETKTLSGHGGAIQDIVTHPTLPHLFATCSDDCEIRIWNLNSRFDNSQCAAILFGENFGHTDTVFTMDWNANGRYLISGGRDTWIHLWSLPPPKEVDQYPKETQISHRIYYPHFSSADVHSNLIDCVGFHGDLIFSHSIGN